METLIEFLTTLNSLSPLAVIALLGTIIFMLVKGKTGAGKQLKAVQENHLHDMPEVVQTMRDMKETLQRIEVKLSEDMAYLKGRINGKGQ